VLRDDTQVLAEATSTRLELALPEPVTVDAAEATSGTYPGHGQHLVAGCFCCGPGRARADGLRIFPGRLQGHGAVAAPWVPEATDADELGIVRPEIVWAALDCPQIWALILSAPPDSTDRIVTGAMETQLLGPVQAGDRHAIVAWPTGGEGRRLFAAAALFSGGGEALAFSPQTAVITDAGTPLSLLAWSR
jgi:hypothetical protein